MALIINDQIFTDGGSTSNAYLNIQRVDMIKDGGLSIFLNLYVNEAARQANVHDVVKSRQVYSRIGLSMDEVSANLTSDSIYTVAYSKVKEKLEANGLTVLDHI